jgi:hypothetical protein
MVGIRNQYSNSLHKNNAAVLLAIEPTNWWTKNTKRIVIIMAAILCTGFSF